LHVRLDLWALTNLLLLFLPLCGLASALQMVVATFSRSFKEAQTQLSFLTIVPIIPGMVQAFVPFKTAYWMMCIPTLGEQILAGKLLRGEPVPAEFVLLCMGATSLAALLCFLLAARLYRGERVFVKGG
jgi:sodium transport system permease protein